MDFSVQGAVLSKTALEKYLKAFIGIVRAQM
jgi:hypothetical protein